MFIMKLIINKSAYVDAVLSILSSFLMHVLLHLLVVYAIHSPF